MKHLIWLFTDIVFGFYDTIDRIKNLFRKKKQTSLICDNVYWCTNCEWMDRLIAYKQLELWTHSK